MRKENEAIKKQLTMQIQDLRRQLVTKKAFDEEETHKEISRLKTEIRFLQKQNGKKLKQQKENNANTNNNNEDVENNVKLANALNTQKKILETENSQLKERINELERNKGVKERSNEGDQSSNRFGGGGKSTKNYITMNDDAFSGKNMFN